MSSKRKDRGGKDKKWKDLENGGVTYEDIILISEGKKIRVNSETLAKNSPVFAKAIEEERERWRVVDTVDDISDAECYIRSLQQQVKLHELSVPGYRYKDVKMVVALLQADGQNVIEMMNADCAFTLLHLAAEYSMRKVIRRCETVLLDELVKLQAKHKKGEVPTNIVFKYLTTSDKYSLEKLKVICIDELAAHTDRTSRAELVEEEHVTDKTKVTIINKMFESVEEHYDRKLSQLQSDTDRKLADITRRREDWNTTVTAWKEDMNYELKVVADGVKEAHDHMSTSSEVTRILEDVKKNVKEITMELSRKNEKHMDQVRDHQAELVSFLYEMKTDEEGMEKRRQRATELIDKMTTAFVKNLIELEKFGRHFKEDVTRDLVKCDMSELQKSVSMNIELQRQFDDLSTEVETLRQSSLEMELKYQKEKEENDKAKEKCRKYMQKYQKINTWLRWAKPVTEDEGKCLCHRHTIARSSMNFS